MFQSQVTAYDLQRFCDLLVVTLKGAVAEPSSAADFFISRPFDVVVRDQAKQPL